MPSLPSPGDRRREEKASRLQCREVTCDQQEFEGHAVLRLAVVTHGRPQRRLNPKERDLTYLAGSPGKQDAASHTAAVVIGDSPAGQAKIRWGCAVATYELGTHQGVVYCIPVFNQPPNKGRKGA